MPSGRQPASHPFRFSTRYGPQTACGACLLPNMTRPTSKRSLISLAITAIVAFAFAVAHVLADAPAPTQDRREALHKQFDAGNFKDAYDGLRAMALAKDDDPRQVGDDMRLAIAALSRLGRLDESDEFREAVVAV